MTQILTKTYSLAEENRITITKTLLLGSILMILMYAYNMYAVITKTVASQNLDKQVAQLEGSVQKLDSEYINLSNKITPEMAKEYGLEQPAVSAYISRTKSVGLNSAASRL